LAIQNPAFAEQIQSAWREAMAKHPSSAAVIFNAASFTMGLGPEGSLDLLRKAKALDDPNHGEKYDKEIATIYTAVEMEAFHPNANINGIELTPDIGARLQAQLESSVDPELLTQVGKLLVEFSNHPASEEQKKRGFQLIRQAIQLDPGNPKWTEALEWAETEPQRRLNYENAARATVPPPGVVRIGAKVAEANLISKTDPVYPPLALQARIQGTAEFTVTVGVDGKVENLALVRGHPLLVNAAKGAVFKWVYHPTSVDGKAIPFQTEVLVPFRLDQ
jgi:protein TonB